MKIDTLVPADAFRAFTRTMKDLGEKRIVQAVDRAMEATNREAAKLLRDELKGELDVPEEKTLRSIQPGKHAARHLKRRRLSLRLS